MSCVMSVAHFQGHPYSTLVSLCGDVTKIGGETVSLLLARRSYAQRHGSLVVCDHVTCASRCVHFPAPHRVHLQPNDKNLGCTSVLDLHPTSRMVLCWHPWSALVVVRWSLGSDDHELKESVPTRLFALKHGAKLVWVQR